MASASFPGPERNQSGYGLGEVDAASPPGGVESAADSASLMSTGPEDAGVESHPAVRTKETAMKEERASRNIESERRDMTDSRGKGRDFDCGDLSE